MFQRLKGAIDSRIAEEQARQRSALNSTSAAHTPGRSSSRGESPSKQTPRNAARSKRSGDLLAKGPDPSDFEPEFVIDDSNAPSRSGTPRPPQERSESSTKVETEEDAAGDVTQGTSGRDKSASEETSSTPSDIPTEVRVKLRKLEKLESRYNELLRSYRIAHSRVSTIDNFEATLRENTPLTSISDPGALVEYLNQLNLKGDMVVDELKRVSSDRDNLKQKLDEAERRAREAWDEVTNLRKPKEDIRTISAEKRLDTFQNSQGSRSNSIDEDLPVVQAKSPASATSRTGSITSFSIFSPKTKPLASPIVKEENEDLFSYDNELPRLEGELRSREERIDELQMEVKTLKGDLAITRESTQSMVQALEETTREVNNLRDSKDRSSAELEEERASFRTQSEKLRADLLAAERTLKDLESERKSQDGDKVTQLQERLEEAQTELVRLRESLSESSGSVSKAGDLQEKIAAMELELKELNDSKLESNKRIETLNRLVRGLREQLTQKDEQIHDLKGVTENRQSTIYSLEEQAVRLRSNLDRLGQTEADIPNSNGKSTVTETQAPIQANENASGKKKNKKKKKGGKPLGDQAVALYTNSSERPAQSTHDLSGSSSESSKRLYLLEEELRQLKATLADKDAAIERLDGKLKDQDDLKEEIETLRDDLINVGQEHVAAKDRVKDLTEEKKRLESSVANLEKELTELRGSQATNNATSEEKHRTLEIQFEDLKTKAATLQTDLSAAQQLASSRFKDISELRSMMQKAQPELISLRNEVIDLKVAKEHLGKKEAELKRAETRNSEMRSELTSQKRVLADRASELKSLYQKINQETSSRSQAEEARTKAQQEVQRLENEARQASDSIDRLSKDLTKAREELARSKNRLTELEQQFASMRNDNEGLKEEIDLKTAQYASAQSLMSSMRDQTAEMATQIKEARERCESLDEEVADAHRLLSERSREGETMRRLLSDVEGKADARVREMKERLDSAIEERDRAEDEASTAARRKARELEDLRNQSREAERAWKRAEDDKDELERAQRDWKKRREELEQKFDLSTHEAAEVRNAMGELRNALDESERQARDLEKQKAELRRSVEETQHRLEKLQKSNKAMADEIRTIQTSKGKGIDSGAHSSRSSVESTPSQARLASPVPKSRQSSSVTTTGTPNGQATGSLDYIYLKNILLQFLEQKDKNHQKQLIPVLGMLLHFDRKDEQKWMSVITSK